MLHLKKFLASNISCLFFPCMCSCLTLTNSTEHERFSLLLLHIGRDRYCSKFVFFSLLARVKNVFTAISFLCTRLSSRYSSYIQQKVRNVVFACILDFVHLNRGMQWLVFVSNYLQVKAAQSKKKKKLSAECC